MSFKNRLKLWTILVTVIVLVMAITPGVSAQTQKFSKLITQSLLVQNTTEFVGDVTADGNLAVVGNLSLTGSSTVGTFSKLTTGATATVTNGGTITPVSSYQPLTSAANVGTGTIAGCASGTAGEYVEFVNIGSNTITITDTGTLKLSGNAVLGVTDVLGVRCDGTNWIQTTKDDN